MNHKLLWLLLASGVWQVMMFVGIITELHAIFVEFSIVHVILFTVFVIIFVSPMSLFLYDAWLMSRKLKLK